MSILTLVTCCVRYFVRLRGSRGDLKVCIFQRLHSNLLQVGDGIPGGLDHVDCRSRESGIGCVCVCVSRMVSFENTPELLWGATSYLLLHPHGHEDEGRHVVVTIAGGKIISLTRSRAWLVHTLFSFKSWTHQYLPSTSDCGKSHRSGRGVQSFFLTLL